MAFEATGWSRDWLIDGVSAPVQLPLRLETLMRKYFDLIGIPKRHFFAILALYSNHELEKERLTEFAASDGTDERWDYANRLGFLPVYSPSSFTHNPPNGSMGRHDS